jgi:hypothetical protein
MNLSLSRLAVVGPALALVFIGVASVAFSWGASSAGSRTAPLAPAFSSPALPTPATSGRGIPRGGAAPAGSVIGIVAGKTASAITVTTLAGQTVTVNVSAATTYSVRGVAGATLDNIAVGDRVIVQGTPKADGSVDATRIQTGAGDRGFGGGGGRSRGGTGLPTPAPSAGLSGPST